MQFDKQGILYTLIFLGLFIGIHDVQAQQQDEPLDPAGYVTKYDRSFNGIGPRVYVLPAPRTREELLTDSYKEKIIFQDSIDKALDFQQLVDELRPTSNAPNMQHLLEPEPSSAQEWNLLVEKEIQRENFSGAYGLLHIYAESILKKGDVQGALNLLQSALQHAQKTTHTSDIATIQYNLANVYLFSKNVQQAGYFQEIYYKTAIKREIIHDQANALTKIALIQAYDKDYRSAENNIIRKAIPLINRAKAYDRKIIAWQTLAKIYQLQNKHTEAQWFLIQARDLARRRQLTEDLAEIEYMLASSKFVQKNYKVAKKEFIQADELAKMEDNRLLRLAIVDKLGQIYMSQSDLDEAENALSTYQELRNELFQE